MKTADHRRRRLRGRPPGARPACARCWPANGSTAWCWPTSRHRRRPARRSARGGPHRPAAGADRRACATERFDGVFHLASAVSGECEVDFELGLRSNLDSTRALLDALRARVDAAASVTRLVFSSSVAVFGPDPAVPLPKLVADDTLPAPQTSYGTQKLICEHLVADYTRKGYIDGRAARLMTVTVRPGRPNGAASSFFSGIIREPLAGVESMCPVSADVSHPVSSPSRTVDGLIAVYEAIARAFWDDRATEPARAQRARERHARRARTGGGPGRARARALPSATSASRASSPTGRRARARSAPSGSA